MIQYLKVKGLNKRLDGEFQFNEDLNIFTGPNGSGKTTLLKLIWYLISGNLDRILAEIPFHFVSIETNMFSLSITYLGSGEVEFALKFNVQDNASSKPLVVAFDSRSENLTSLENAIKLDKIKSQVASMTRSSIFFPTFRRIEEGFSSLFRDMSTGPGAKLLSRYQATGRVQEFQDAISELSSDVSVHNHKFIISISTDDIAALLMKKYVPISKKIDELQTNVLHEIARKTKDYSVSEKEFETQTSPKSHFELNDIQKKIEKVTTDRGVLLQPFSVLSDLTRNILEYRAIHVTGQVAGGEDTEGITLSEGKSGITVGKAKNAISSDKLSSGEKQMLSFLCYNAFYNNTPIFIDEPELSLHIDWQRLLLPTLLDQSTGNQFFIATHSPFIFTGYQHKEIPLKSD